MNQIVTGIEVIKMYTWEKPFSKFVEKARQEELRHITTTSYYQGVRSGSVLVLPRVSLYLTLACFVQLGHSITAEKVFPVVQCMNVLQIAFVILFPYAMINGAEALSAVKRLKEFLMLEEKELSSIENLNEASIVIENVTACWTPGIPTLENISFRIIPGTLCAIVGPVGSGKSSLVQVRTVFNFSSKIT